MKQWRGRRRRHAFIYLSSCAVWRERLFWTGCILASVSSHAPHPGDLKFMWIDARGAERTRGREDGITHAPAGLSGELKCRGAIPVFGCIDFTHYKHLPLIKGHVRMCFRLISKVWGDFECFIARKEKGLICNPLRPFKIHWRTEEMWNPKSLRFAHPLNIYDADLLPPRTQKWIPSIIKLQWLWLFCFFIVCLTHFFYLMSCRRRWNNPLKRLDVMPCYVILTSDKYTGVLEVSQIPKH